MRNRLADAVSPYLRSHADNPVDWYPWGTDAFAEAERRQVPVLISIGYSTCHWCHVMARESFSDSELAAHLNERFVAIKVDREEHPDVDATYLAAASAFTDQLGWPLTVFADARGRAFYAGTYFPPVAVGGRPSFREILDAVTDAWRARRDEVDDTASRLAAALAHSALAGASAGRDFEAESAVGRLNFVAVVAELQQYEDPEFGGFGGAPKFPVATVLRFLLDRGEAGDPDAAALAARMLGAMASSALRDPIEGGFFRYATRRDWTEPHYERMLYDNALLLDAYSRIPAGRAVAEGIASFLLTVMRLPSGGFASAQDSESTVDGQRVEGGYYALDAEHRAAQRPPALDDKVLTGWNGLAIGALAAAGTRLGHPEWITAAEAAADLISNEPIRRARIGGRTSDAKPTLEDYGMLADGLVDLALATGSVRFAVRARELVEACLVDLIKADVIKADGLTADGLATDDARADGPGERAERFRVPGGADPVLVANGLALEVDPSEGAYPSGLSAISRAAVRLDLLGGDRRLRDAATRAMAGIADQASERPISFGGTLGVLSLLAEPAQQLVIVTNDPMSELVRAASGAVAAQPALQPTVTSIVTRGQAEAFAKAGFELYEARGLRDGKPTAYLCEDFVCQLPVTEPGDLLALLRQR
jgi:uncharacterized protein YyaL (SSP411 family)